MLEQTLNHPLGLRRTATHVQARVYLAQLFGLIGDFGAARAHYEEALLLARELGDIRQQVSVLERIGWVAREQGDSASAWQWMMESLAMCRNLGDTASSASTLISMAGIAIAEEDPVRAVELLTESQGAVQQGHEDNATNFWFLNHLGYAAQLRGAYDLAAQYHEKSLALIATDPAPSAASIAAYHGLGETAMGRGRLDEAKRWLTKALVASHGIGERPYIAWCLASLGSVAAFDAEPACAARLWGAAEQLRQTLGCRSAPAVRTTYERAMTIARAALGEEAFALAWKQGRVLTLERAFTDALEGSDVDAVSSVTSPTS